MKPNFTSKLLLLLIFISIFSAKSQVLMDTDLDLNPGGAIYDVAYDSYLDAYIVVGDFTHVNGQPRNNLAIIDAQDMTLSTTELINSIDGPIRSVVLHKRESITQCCPLYYTQGLYSIFIGGNFTQVNSEQRIDVARFGYSFFNSPVDDEDYILRNWDAEIMNIDGYVNDLQVNNDTLLIGGYYTIDSPTYDASFQCNNIAAFDVNFNFASPITNQFTHSSFDRIKTGAAQVFNIENISNNDYMINAFTYDPYSTSLSDAFVSRYNSYNGLIYSYPSNYYGSPQTSGGDCFRNYHMFENSYDTLLFISKWHIETKYSAIYDFSTTVKNVTISPNLYYPDEDNLNVSSYKNSVFFNEDENYVLKTYDYTGDSLIRTSLNYLNSPSLVPLAYDSTVTGGSVSNYTPWYADINDPLSGYSQVSAWQPNKIYRVRDKLIISGNQLTEVNSQSRVGLSVFCLEPRNAKPFTVADSFVCTGNIRDYIIPKADYAEGYKWTYSGDGVLIRNSTNSNYDTLNPGESVFYSDTSAASVQIKFASGMTAGSLTVQPYSFCNGTADTLFSKGQTINLTTAPLPPISMIDDSLSFNCFNSDSVKLEMITTGTNNVYTWSKGTSSDTLNTDSLFVVYNDTTVTDSTISSAFMFYGSVQEPINGCTSTDSIFVYYDTIPPGITQNDLFTTPSQFDCSTDSMVFEGNVPNSTIEWGLTDSTTFATDAFTLYSPSPDTATVYAHATDTINGCVATQQFMYEEFFDSIEPIFPDYASYNGGTIDSIKCIPPELLLAIDLPNTGNSLPSDSVSWLHNNQYIGDTLILSQLDTIGTNGNNYLIIDYTTYSDSSKCTFNGQVAVEFDLEVPFIPNMSNIPTINCSADSVLLIHPIVGNSDYQEGWLDNTFQNTFSDSIFTDTTGIFYFETTDTTNGCVNRDTVVVMEINELLLNSSPDTLICLDDTVAINTTPINYTDPVEYDWSSGATTSAVNAIGGVDDSLFVTVQGVNDNCIGFDTIVVETNPEIYAEFSSFAGCTGGSGSLQLDSISGGAGGYEYAIDGGTFGTISSFSNLSFGLHYVEIRDAIGCSNTFEVEVTSNTGSPNMEFLVSTYNEIGDTVYAVNTSPFTGFDSLVWIVPNDIEVVDVSDSMLVFTSSFEGWYNLELLGYQDTCSYSYTKPVSFGQDKPEFTNGSDTLGIQSYNIYPNPTNGQFAVEVEFGVAQSYSIIVTNNNGQPIQGMSTSGNDETINTNFTFPGGTSTGSYQIHIIGTHDAVSTSIIYQ